MPNLTAALLYMLTHNTKTMRDTATGIIYTVESLLAAGADPNARRPDGFTALMIAADCDPENLSLAKSNVEALLAAGADVNAKWGDTTVLMIAALAGHTDIVKLLIDKGANIEDENNDGKTALIMAVQQYHSEIVDLLIKSGANIHVKDVDGRTALMTESFFADEFHESYQKISERLINAGVDVYAKDNLNKTTLMYVAHNGSEEVAKLLIEKGVSFDAQDDEGRTALMYAARSANHGTLKLLIDKGADINVEDQEGLTVLAHALIERADEFRYEDIIRPIIRAGSDMNVLAQSEYYDVQPKTINRMVCDYIVSESEKGHDLLNFTKSTGLLDQFVKDVLSLETVLLVAMAPNTDPVGRNLIIENFNQREVQRYKDNACLIDPTNNNILGAGIETFQQLVELSSWNREYLDDLLRNSLTDALSNWGKVGKMEKDFMLKIVHDLPARTQALEGQQKVQYLLANVENIGDAISGKSQSNEDEIKSTTILATLNSLSQAERFRLKTTMAADAAKRGVPEPEILNSVRALDQYFEKITATPAPNVQPDAAQALSSNNSQRAI